LASPG